MQDGNARTIFEFMGWTRLEWDPHNYEWRGVERGGKRIKRAYFPSVQSLGNRLAAAGWWVEIENHTKTSWTARISQVIGDDTKIFKHTAPRMIDALLMVAIVAASWRTPDD